VVDGVVVHNAQEAAEVLVRAIGLHFGELTIKVSDRGVAVLRATRTLDAKELRALKIGGP
jgi:hypothetical protein